MSSSKPEKKQQREQLSSLPDKLDHYQIPPEERPVKKKPTSQEERQALVEQRIQEAMERGEFDNLPGKGKPLKLDKNPYLEPGQELGFGLLKKNGFAPEWIERDKESRRELDAARSHLQQTWQQRQGNPANESKWQIAMAHFEERLHKLNCKIDDFREFQKNNDPKTRQNSLEILIYRPYNGNSLAFSRIWRIFLGSFKNWKSLNLIVPIVSLQRSRLRVDDEVKSVQKKGDAL